MLAALCRSCAARAALAYARVPRGEAPVNSGRLRWRAQAAGAANASLWESTEQFWYVKYALAAVLDPSARRLELDEPLTKNATNVERSAQRRTYTEFKERYLRRRIRQEQSGGDLCISS